MSRFGPGRASAVVMLAVALTACGKKGNPLPPLRPVPARIPDLAATRTAEAVELRFTLPTDNVDGTTPVAIERVDVYGVAAEPGQAPPGVGQVIGDERQLLGRIPVGGRGTEPAVSGASPEGERPLPAPGDEVTFVHTPAAEARAAEVVLYALVPVAGSGRGRPGPPSPLISVPMGELPAAPTGVAIDYDESALRVVWQPAADGLVYRLYRGDADVGSPALNAEALAAAPFTAPVEFGRELCVTVRAFAETGVVSLAGPPSTPVCVTPEDRFAPPAPSGLRVVQEGPAVVLVWDAVEADDLAGYVVLRGDGLTAALTPLFSEPIRQTTYRDTAATAGATYTYAVYAVDSSPAANVGPTSEHQTLTVR